MLQTLHPYPNADKTAEIMARYRPIAPRPDVLQLNPKMTTQSPPYLTNAWPAARPTTRTRKRGRSSVVGPPPHPTKRSRSTFLSPSPQPTKTFPPNLQALVHSPNNAFTLGSLTPVTTQATLVTLPLLPCPTDFNVAGENIIDLNTVAQVPQEKDFLHLLQGRTTNNVVIAPQAVRPVGSSIFIRSIRGNPDPTPEVKLVKKAEEVEEEIESERSPVVVTDSNNKVRVVNSAYKEMVGQPECLWLDSMVTHCEGRHGGLACSSSKRICGEVTLQFPPESGQIDSNGFSCWARIEWGSNGKKRSVDSACRAIRLYCESKDYLLAWRFNTREVFECPCFTNL